MLNALLAPFSRERWVRHLETGLDGYYNSLTRESLQSQLRSDLLDNDRRGLVGELRQASKKQTPLRRTFDEFAVNDGGSDGKVWTQSSFAAFISTRLGQNEGDAANHQARALWRGFCYNAIYPFADTSSDPEEQHVDLAGWTQAVALLATDAVGSVGRHRRGLSLYGDSHTPEVQKACDWRRYASLATLSDAEGGIATDNDDWKPPNMLDEVARVAATHLPIPMKMRGPSMAEVRLKVQRLVVESSSTSASTGDLVVPYGELLALLRAVTQVTKKEKFHDRTDDEAGAWISLDGDREAQEAAARALLAAGGIHKEADVSFARYAEFSEKFHSAIRWPNWSFDDEISFLWRALFLTQPPTPSSAQKQPPSVVLQALDFLYPFERTSFARGFRQQTALECSTDGLSRDTVLKALTWPYSPKLTVIYGRTAAPTAHAEDGQPALFALLTPSPLWCTYTTGAINDFRVGEQHLLLQLAPRARALWYADPDARFADFVDTTSDQGKMSFARADGSASKSGLTLDFEKGVARMRASPQGMEGKDGYVEVEVGPREGPAKRVEGAEAWETVVSIERIEVWSLPAGVEVRLSVKREKGDED